MRQTGPACRQCRIGKRKCNRPVAEACQPCAKRQLDCSSGIFPRKNPSIRPASSGLSNGSKHAELQTGVRSELVSANQDHVSSSLTKDDTQELVGYYIDYIHDKPHTLFHAPSLRYEVGVGSIDTALLSTVLALSATFSPSESTRALGPAFALEAKKLLEADLEDVSLTKIQAWIVLGNFYGSECKYVSESLSFGMAIRLAHITGLANPKPADNAIMKETRSRIWWTLFMLDRWSSAGLGTPRQMPDRQPSQQLPLSEHTFQSLASDAMDWPEQDPEPGLWAYMITLVETFGPIQDLNRLLATEFVDELYVASTVSALAQRLEGWQINLPENVRLTVASLEFHKSRGHGRTFVALHLGYYHYATLLFFQYIDQSASDLPHATVYAERCREHASAFSDLLRTSYEVEGCDAVYMIVAHMTVVSSSVLIHTLLFGNKDQLQPAKARLESNFKVLMKLKYWWPSVAPMTDKLILFQRACLRSADEHTHKIDRWMVKFLLEHGNPLGDKSNEVDLSTPSPQSFADSPTAHKLSERNQFTRQALSELR